MRVKPKRWPALLDFARRLESAKDTPQGACVSGVTAEELRSFGDDLYAIAMGKDAREVFEQAGKRGNQSEGVLQWNRSLVYWHARATGKSIDEAVAVAQRRYRHKMAPSRAAIIRYGRKYRDHAFRVLQKSGYNLIELKAELQSRSRRGRD